EVPGADILALSATVSLSGQGAMVDPSTGADALANLGSIDVAGSLSLLDGAQLTTSGPLSNGHTLAVAARSALTVGGSFTQAGAGNTYVLQYDPSAAVLVVRPTTMSFVPIAGQPGSQFTVTGDGFSPGEPVGLTIKSIQLQQAVADGDGHFVVVETVPTLTVG